MKKLLNILCIIYAFALTGCGGMFSVTDEEVTAANDTNRWRAEQIARKAHTAEVFAIACIGAIPTVTQEFSEDGTVASETTTYEATAPTDCTNAPEDQYATCVMAKAMGDYARAGCVADVADDAKDASNVGVITAHSSSAALAGSVVDGVKALAPVILTVGVARELRKTAESNNELLAGAIENAGHNTQISGSYNTDHSGDITRIRQGPGSVNGSGSITNVSGNGRNNSPGDNGCLGQDLNNCQPTNSLNPTTNNPAPVVVVPPVVNTPVIVNGRVCALVPVDPADLTLGLTLQCDP